MTKNYNKSLTQSQQKRKDEKGVVLYKKSQQSSQMLCELQTINSLKTPKVLIRIIEKKFS